MSGTTVRDVVIRVRTEQIQADLKPPGMSAFTAGMNDVRSIVTKATEETERQFAETKVVGPDLSVFTSDLQRIANASEATARAVEGGFGRMAAPAEVAEKSVADVAKEAEKARVAIEDASISAATEFTKIGTGAITVAQGVAFLGISSEENMAKAVAGIAKFQGGIQLLQGSKDVFDGLVKSKRALAAAGGVLTVANTALSAAQTAVTATAVSAAAGVRTLTAAMLSNPITAVITGLTLAVGALAAKWAFFDDAGSRAEAAAPGVDRFANSVRETRKTVDETEVAIDRLVKASDLLFARDALVMPFDASNIESISQRINQIQQQAFERQKAIIGQLRQSSVLVDTIVSRQGFMVREMSNAELAFDFEHRIDDAQAELDAVQRVRQEAEAVRRQREEELRLSQRKLDIAKDTLATHRQETQELRDALAVARESAEQARKEAESRAQSFEQRIGQLDAREVAELEQLRQKRTSGQSLTEAEAQRVADLTGQTKFVDDIQRERGASRGARDIARDFDFDITGGAAAQAQAQDRIADTLQQQSRQMEQRASLLEKNVSKMRQEQEQAVVRLDTAIERLLTLDGIIGRIELIVRRIVEEERNRTAGNQVN